MGYALPVLPPITEVQEQRLEELVTEYGIARSGMNCKERTSLIFLTQTLFYIELTKEHPNSIALEAYIKLANENYEAYLKYIKD